MDAVKSASTSASLVTATALPSLSLASAMAVCASAYFAAVIFANYNDFNMILASDIHMQVERDMINLGLLPNKPIDVLKIAHHGMDTSTSKEFIDALRPKFGVITRSQRVYNPVNSNVGINKLLNDYNVDLLETWRGTIKVYATDKDWNIEY